MLESRYAEHDGLNLTWETLEGILKHNGPVIAGPPAIDLEPHTHAGLEAQVAAIADDIAYDAHDIDDALRAGLIVARRSRRRAAGRPHRPRGQTRWPDLERRRQAHEVQRRLITRTIEDVIATTAAAHRRGRAPDRSKTSAPSAAPWSPSRPTSPPPSTPSSASCSSASTAAKP